MSSSNRACIFCSFDSVRHRDYIPMGFINAGTIVTDRVQIIPDADLYDFGVIISKVQMAWMKVTDSICKTEV